MAKKEKPYRQCKERNGSQDTTKKEKECQYMVKKEKPWDTVKNDQVVRKKVKKEIISKHFEEEKGFKNMEKKGTKHDEEMKGLGTK
jgi:hypothetical protein